MSVSPGGCLLVFLVKDRIWALLASSSLNMLMTCYFKPSAGKQPCLAHVQVANMVSIDANSKHDALRHSPRDEAAARTSALLRLAGVVC